MIVSQKKMAVLEILFGVCLVPAGCLELPVTMKDTGTDQAEKRFWVTGYRYKPSPQNRDSGNHPKITDTLRHNRYSTGKKHGDHGSFPTP
jgi:hypothetical protein